MPTDELESELRSTFARAATDFADPEAARQRLIRRDYHPRRGNRRLAGSIAAAATVAALVLSLGLSGLFGSGGQAPGHGANPVRLAAFSAVSNPDGSVTLILRPGVPFHPSALQHLLARHGVPALVRVRSYCYSNPPPNAPGAVRTEPKLKSYPPGHPLPKMTKLVIKAGRLPARTEIGFGFFHHNLVFIQNVIYTHAHTCASSPPTP